jgi:hypothetical protein
MSIKPYVKVILLVIFLIIGIIAIMTSGKTADTIESRILNDHKKSILAYEIIDMEKDLIKTINDMIIKSDTMLTKSESGLQMNLTEAVPAKITELSELLSSEAEKEIFAEITKIRSSMEPIQNKVLKLLNIQARTAELILLYGEMKQLQENYFVQLKLLIEDANSDLEESVASSSSSASNTHILVYALLIFGGAVILILLIGSIMKRKTA